MPGFTQIMGWIRNLLSPMENSIEDVQPQREERFPSHTYGPGYPIVIRRQELDELDRLLKVESEVPDSWDNAPFLSRKDFEEVLEQTIGDEGIPSLEERRDEIRDILELWRQQLTGSEDVVWTTRSTEYHFKFYIIECEARADVDDDDFEELDELDTARDILDRIQTVQNSNTKLAIVHKRDLPLEEPGENQSETD